MTEIVIANPGSDLPFPTSLPEFMRLFRFNRRFYPFNAFRSLLGIGGGAESPTYKPARVSP